MSTFDRSQRNAQVEQVLAALHRVCRTALLHRPNNEAVRQTIEQSFAVFGPWHGSGGERLSLLFVDDTLYVNGDLLRLPQEQLEAAIAIGETLDRIGCNELAIYGGLLQEDLTRLAAAVHAGTAEGASSGALQLRRIDPELLSLLRRTSASPRERLQQGYISALVLLRVLDAGALADEAPATGSLRSVVRQLVAAADEDPVAFRSLVVAPLAHHDRPGQCVKAAVVTIECCRWLGVEWHLQVQLALVALLADLARIRAVRSGLDPSARKLPALPVLNETQLDRLPGAAATVALLSDRPGEDVVERAVIALNAFAVPARCAAEPDLATLLAFVPRVCRELTELAAYDVFTQQALSLEEAADELRTLLSGTPLAAALELVASVALTAASSPGGEGSDAPAGQATRGPLSSDAPLPAAHLQHAGAASTPTQADSPMTTRRSARGADASPEAARPEPASTHPAGSGPLAAGEPSAPVGSASPGDTDFTAMVRHYYGANEAPVTRPADPANALVTREFRTGPMSATHESTPARSAPPEPTAAPSEASAIPRFGRTEPSIPTSALLQARDTLSDGSTGRFRISVDPLTGTLQADDSQVGSSTDPGLGRAPIVHSATLPGLPATALGPPSHPFDSPEAFLRERQTPAVHLRHAALDSDSQLGADSGRRLRDSDEYDVHVADLQQARQAEVQSAHLISRAKTPPRPLPAVVEPSPPPVPRTEIPTLEVTATESARILGAFSRGRSPLPAAELRRALAVTAEESDAPATAAKVPAVPTAPVTPFAAPVAPSAAASHVSGQTRSFGDAIDDARRLAEASLLPDAPAGSTLDMTAPAEAALASVARLAVQKASELSANTAAEPTAVPATDPGPATPEASGKLRSAVRRTEPSGAQSVPGVPSEIAPILARAEEWSITQTLDVGAIQARRYLEAFARNQRRKPETQSAGSGTVDPPAPTAAQHSAPTPLPAPTTVPEATAPPTPLEPMYDADGTPITWRRSRETVKRLREQRHSGSLPVLARPRRNLADLGDSVDDLLRKYLNDK